MYYCLQFMLVEECINGIVVFLCYEFEGARQRMLGSSMSFII